MSKFAKASAIFLLTLIISYVVLAFVKGNVCKITFDLVLPSLGVLVGLLIGAVGVFLGSLGNLYALMQVNINTNVKDLEAFFRFMNNTIREIKQNVIFTICAFTANLIIPIIKNSDIPLIKMTHDTRWWSKDIVLATLSLWLMLCAVVAIVDSVEAMFKLHHHYEYVIKDNLNANKESGDGKEG